MRGEASHAFVLVATGILLCALIGADFALDRLIDAGLLGAAQAAPDKVVRLERLRLAEQTGLALTVIGAMVLGLGWTRRVERLHAEKEALARSRADLQKMAGILAHEVNGQLTVLQNTVDVLGRQFAGHAMVRVQEESVEHLRGLVTDYRLLGGSEKLILSPADAREIAQGAVAALGLSLDVSGPGELPFRADRLALLRALQNLLRNAMEAGGPVRFGIESLERGARFTVEDEGPGLVAEVARRAGEAFFTTKPRGTGLGLAIVTEIARRHGGTFTLRSKASGKGAVAVLEIPS